jgi:glycine/D-amino acid oxidase-like deaminating enzyme
MSSDTRSRVAIAGASIVGLLVALELRSRSIDVVVFERAAKPLTDASLPAPVPLEPDESDQLRSWLARHRVYPLAEPVGPAGDGFDAQRLWLALLARGDAEHVQIVWGRRVLGVTVAGGAVTAVRTDAGESAVDGIVIAAGAGAAAITAALGLQLPVLPECSAWMRLEGLEAPRGWLVRAEPVDVSRTGVHFACIWSEGDGRGLVGAYRSFGAAGERRDTLARSYLAEVAQRLAPAAACDATVAWRLHAHTSADHLPVVGSMATTPGVVVALPHGPSGNARAVEIARGACDAVMDPEGSRRHAWSLARFPQGATGGRMASAR